MGKKRKHTVYSYQFKSTAVRLSEHADIQGRSVAEALDIHPIMLYRWKREMKDGKIRDNEGKRSAEAELQAAKKRIKSLEGELERLREENVVLKKAERMFGGKK